MPIVLSNLIGTRAKETNLAVRVLYRTSTSSSESKHKEAEEKTRNDKEPPTKEPTKQFSVLREHISERSEAGGRPAENIGNKIGKIQSGIRTTPSNGGTYISNKDCNVVLCTFMRHTLV